MNELFLDHASTTPVHPDAVGLMLPFFGNHFGIPSAPSDLHPRPRHALDEARARVAALINALDHEIVFTSGGTEANNLALLGAARARGGRGRHIITSAVEHASVYGPVRHLEEEGFRVTIVPVDAAGRVDPATVREAVSCDTILISIMHASHLTGAVQPIEEIGALARSRGIIFHTDAVQGPGLAPIDVKALPVDLLSVSSHKLYGPKGAGALYVRQGVEISPIIFGSGEERGIRPGTLNLPAIVGFGKACGIARGSLENNRVLVTSLKESLEEQLCRRVEGVSVLSAGAPRLPHITCLCVEGVRSDALAARLDAMGIIVSAVAPGGDTDLFRVFDVVPGVPRQDRAVRISLGWENRERDVRRTVEGIEKAVISIREFSRASQGRETGMVTFPDRESALSALAVLGNEGVPFLASYRDSRLLAPTGSSLTVLCVRDDEERVGRLLGGNGIRIGSIGRSFPSGGAAGKKIGELRARAGRTRRGKAD